MDDSRSILSRALFKFKENPFFYTGTGLLAGIVGTGLYGLKNRKLRLSLYLINLRLAAQGSFVAVMTGGVVYMLITHYSKKENTIDDKYVKK